MPTFRCVLCDKVYNQHRNLRRHVKLFHEKIDDRTVPSLKTEPLEWFCCSSCPKKYRNSNYLRAHNAKEHGVCVRKRTRKPLHSCPLRCGYNTSDTPQLIFHIKTNHGINVETVNLRFHDYETFFSWKEETEYNTTSKFVVSAPKYSSSQKTKYYFSCHRSGNFVSEGKGRVHLKKQGSKKINGFCPAGIKVTEYKSGGDCEVVFVKTHVGHSNDLCHLSLRTKERISLAMKIAANVPFDTILEDLQTSRHSTQDRVQLVTRKDLHNIRCTMKKDKFIANVISLKTREGSPEINNVQARHEGSLQMSTDKVTEEGGCWLVPAEDDCGKIHKIQKAPKNCEGCGRLCSDCNTCIHAYTCTCVDFAIRRNMCEHIHLVCRYISLMNSDVNQTFGGNRCNFQALVDSNCEVLNEGDCEELAPSQRSHGGDGTVLSLSLDTRKKQMLDYFQEVLSSATTMQEIDVIDKILAKIKSDISAVGCRVGNLTSVTRTVSGSNVES